VPRVPWPASSDPSGSATTETRFLLRLGICEVVCCEVFERIFESANVAISLFFSWGFITQKAGTCAGEAAQSVERRARPFLAGFKPRSTKREHGRAVLRRLEFWFSFISSGLQRVLIADPRLEKQGVGGGSVVGRGTRPGSGANARLCASESAQSVLKATRRFLAGFPDPKRRDARCAEPSRPTKMEDAGGRAMIRGPRPSMNPARKPTTLHIAGGQVRSSRPEAHLWLSG
jgi:hypothetical protein